jgi:hypothetical protein
VWLEPGKKDAFPRLCLENILSYVYVEFSVENVEELVFTRMHMRRWVIAGC